MAIEVTARLLSRYHQGQCTEDEKEAVIEWLLDPEQGGELRLPESEDESIHKARIWEGISKGIQKTTPPVFQMRSYKNRLRALASFSRFAVAASLIFGLCGLVALSYYFTSTNRPEIAMDNLSGRQTKVARTANLAFTLSPQSKAEMNTSLWGDATQIKFCGAIEITNESGKDINMVFYSDCKNSYYTQQTVRMAKGRSYLAMHYHLKTDEIIVVDKARFLDLPPTLVSQLIKDFNLI